MAEAEHVPGGRRGIKARALTIYCAKCPAMFSAQVITKAPTLCEPCRKARIQRMEKERLARRRVTEETRSGRRTRPKIKLKLIPYAGYIHEELKYERGQFYAGFPFVEALRAGKGKS